VSSAKSTPKHLNTQAHRLAIFASGSGTNAEEILKHFQQHPSIEVVILLSNNREAYALERAKKFNVRGSVFTRSQFRETDEVLNLLKENNVTHLILAGFMWLVPDNLVKAFPGRIINIHPALLPKFGGKGMYGMHVHEAVKASGEKETGITIHEVNERYDEGKILFRAKCIVAPTDTPEEIANKVHSLEHKHYPKIIEGWVNQKG
jgi:phosphoribosylglycinamide formyltransferase-1